MVKRKTMRRCGGGGRRERGNLLMRCCGEVTRLGSETLRQYTTAPQHHSTTALFCLTTVDVDRPHCTALRCCQSSVGVGARHSQHESGQPTVLEGIREFGLSQH